MTKQYKILQKKLRKLESALALSSELTESYVESVYSQFAFLNLLLSREIASNPSKPVHLHHIEDHVAKLRATFDDRVSGLDPVETCYDPIEMGSDCSCTESCLNDDGDVAVDNQEFYDLEFDEYENDQEEELFYETDANNRDSDMCIDTGRFELGMDNKKRAGKFSVWGNNRPVFAGGVVIGVVLMGVLAEFYGCFTNSYGNYQGYLIPT